MIQMMTAYTEEVDEVEDGIAEILGQIDITTLKKNSVGLVTCHVDFTNAGFIGELCKRLPFNIIGMTTMASANQYGQSMYGFSLTVLTSDDLLFQSAATGPLGLDDYHQKIEKTYSDTVEKLPGKPSLILAFFPYIQELSGALIHKSFDKICGGVPFWGSIATNQEVSFERCYAFSNNDVGKDSLVMILIHGQIDPEFIVVSMPTENIRKNRGLITNSDGCQLKEINGVSALNYLESLGVVVMKDSSIVTPLMVYYEGSAEPVALGIYKVNDDGSVLCGGDTPVGASVAVGEITGDGILQSAKEGMDRIIHSTRRNGALLLPCVTRYVMMPDHNEELELIAGKMKTIGTMPYMVGYAGGEICPVLNESGVFQNRFHNFTFSACIF